MAEATEHKPSAEPVETPPEAPVPVDTSPAAATPLPTADVHGDPLPPGARARLGTFRHRIPGSRVGLFLPNQGPLLAWWRVERNKIVEGDVATGEILRTFDDPGDRHDTRVASDRSFLLVSTKDGNAIEKRDVAGKVLATMPFPPSRKKSSNKRVSIPLWGTPSGFVVSTDDRRMALWRDRNVILYDLATGAARGRVAVPPPKKKARPTSPKAKPEPPPPVQIVDVAGDRVVITDGNRGLGLVSADNAVWDLRARRKLHQTSGSVALSPDGRHMAVGEGNELKWMTVAGKVVTKKTLSGAKPSGFSFGPELTSLEMSANGARIAGRKDGKIHIFDTPGAGGGGLREVEVVDDAWFFGFSANGQRVVVKREGHYYARPATDVDLPDTPSGHHERINEVTFGPYGRVVSTVGGGLWRLWDPETGEGLSHIRPEDDFDDGYDAVVISKENVLALTDRRAWMGSWGQGSPAKAVGKELAHVALNDRGFASIVEPGWNDQGGRDPEKVSWHDLEGDVRWSHEVINAGNLALTDDRVLVATGGAIKAFDMATGDLVAELEGVGGAMVVVGDRIFVDDHGVTIVAFDGSSLRPLRRLVGVSSSMLSISPDGKLFAAATYDRSIIVSTADGVKGQFPVAHDKAITALAFSPDGTRLVSGSRDGTALVWDLAHLQPWTPAPSKPIKLENIGSDLRQPDPQCKIDDKGDDHCGYLSKKVTVPADAHELAGNTSYACAIVGAQRLVRCWESGKSFRDPMKPVAIGTIAGARQLSLYGHGGCVIDGKNAATCWGKPIGMAAMTSPRTLATNVAEVELSGGRGCLRKQDGSVWCWGNGAETIGSAKRLEKAALRKIEGLGKAVDLSVAGDQACVALADGTARCWGKGASFVLGDGRGLSSAKPVTVAGVKDVRAVQVSYGISCALTKAGAVSCWGDRHGLRGALRAVAEPKPVATGIDALGGENAICMRRGKAWSCM